MANHIPHKAARLLGHLGKRGVGVTMHTPPWSVERKNRALTRGPHKSSHGEREFVSAEMIDFCRQGYWVVLPQDVVSEWPHLRISPLGVVPQRDRRPRLIVDYSFSDVNNETVQLAPKEAMQFGRALQRVFTTIVHANRRYGPVYLSKIDIADGFYRVWLQIDDIPKLGVALPTAPGSSPLVAFPLALPMGWVLSPPYFTVLTETASDLANAALQAQPPDSRLTQAHRLEAVADTPPADADSCAMLPHGPPPSLAVTGRPPVAYVDVYVDDFLLMAQTMSQKRKVLRATLNAIDDVFRPLESGDPPHRTEPASVKKMLKGDAFWSTWKRILGWDIDTVSETLHLPPHRVARLQEILSWLRPPTKRLPVKRWHQLLGELRSMSPALFSILQEALSRGDRHRVRLNQAVYDTATDFSVLVEAVATRPTRLRELVPTAPSDVGACDACQAGMGGVWFDAVDPTAAPIVWRHRFPPRIASSLITATNKTGSVSISDLELAGTIAHKDVLARHRNVAERTIWVASDNRAAISWSAKGSSTSVDARAYLLRYNAFHQRAHRYVARHHYIPGPVNAMADDASRLWTLSDAALLTHFNTSYPQATSWQMLHLSPETSASLIGALSRKRQLCAALLNVAPTPPHHGRSGRPFVPASASTPLAWIPPEIPSLFSNSTPIATAAAPWPPVVDLSGLARWKMPYERWTRRTPGWGPLTLV
ncbi:adenylate kinase [Fragilaria crotonensis]|nr:adenylate kinase [Fragilaria crotonensis]